MTQLKKFQEIIQKAIRIANADKKRKEFTKRDKKGDSLFAMVPYPLLFNKHVTTMDIAVYAIILGYCKMRKTDSVRISQGKIADVLETNQRVISRSILLLESIDWLAVERRDKTTSTYCPRTTETLKAQEKRVFEIELKRKRKPNGLQELFLKQWSESEEDRKEFLKWFVSLSEEEARQVYQDYPDSVAYANEED